MFATAPSTSAWSDMKLYEALSANQGKSAVAVTTDLPSDEILYFDMRSMLFGAADPKTAEAAGGCSAGKVRVCNNQRNTRAITFKA